MEPVQCNLAEPKIKLLQPAHQTAESFRVRMMFELVTLTVTMTIESRLAPRGLDSSLLERRPATADARFAGSE
jgi:hypothetical protein